MNDLRLDLAESWLELSETIDVSGTPYVAAADIARIVVRLIRTRRLSELDYTSIRDNCIASTSQIARGVFPVTHLLYLFAIRSSTAKNPDILTYVCGLEFGTFALSGHSITQMLARGKHALAALGEDLQPVSKLMATSFVQMAANLQSSSEEPMKMAGQYLPTAAQP